MKKILKDILIILITYLMILITILIYLTILILSPIIIFIHKIRDRYKMSKS
jgi:hypothetical protein